MNPVAKALWYIDSHFEQEISLEDIANCAGVSRFHLLRAFGSATGQLLDQFFIVGFDGAGRCTYGYVNQGSPYASH